MIYKIKNDLLSVEAETLGAQLLNLKNLENKNFLHNGTGSFNNVAPWLFPFIGRMKNSEYIYQNKKYNSTIHGFIRKREFKGEQIEENKVKFTYQSDDKDYQIYPFKFLLNIEYTLIKKELVIDIRVENLDEKNMYFSFGFHPGFKVNSTLEDYSISFNKDSLCEIEMSDNQLSFHKTTTKELENNKLKLSSSLFDRDALIFKDWDERATLLKKNNSNGLTITSEGFQFLTIWQRPKSSDKYICIEPCSAIPGYEGEDFILEERLDYFNIPSSNKKDLKIKIDVGD